MRLLLFDVDGTLVHSQGAGRRAMLFALKEVFGTKDSFHDYRMHGKTDPQIITDLLSSHGIDPASIAEGLPRVFELMTERGRQIFPQSGITPCPGVPALLNELRRREDVLLGLQTGNISTTAPLKLSAAGIDPGQFKVGAYGSDSRHREDFPAIAMKRASELTDYCFTGINTVVVGDTPADIECARAGGTKAIAVATGGNSIGALARHRPDALFEDLGDTDSVLAALLS